MASYLVSLYIFVDEECHIALCGGESDDIQIAMQSVKANLGAFFEKRLWFGVRCELRLYPIKNTWDLKEEFVGGRTP